MADETPPKDTERGEAVADVGDQTVSADAEPAAPKLSGKQERARRDHLAKSQRGPRSAQERDAERRDVRAKKAVARRRRREQEKVKRVAARDGATGERSAGTPPAPPKNTTPQMRTGTVVSAKPDKTITVRIDVTRRHRVYKKIVRESTKLRVHDELGEANAGDTVRVVESRPTSATKRWRLVEVTERVR